MTLPCADWREVLVGSRLQVSVPDMRPTRRRCGGRHVDEHMYMCMCLVDMASTGGSRPNRISLWRVTALHLRGGVTAKTSRLGTLEWVLEAQLTEASDRRPRPSRDVLPATDFLGSSRAFRGCLGGLWVGANGRPHSSQRPREAQTTQSVPEGDYGTTRVNSTLSSVTILYLLAYLLTPRHPPASHARVRACACVRVSE